MSARFGFVSFLNNTPYTVELRADGRRVFVCPVYNIVTVPIDTGGQVSDINYTVTWAGVGVDQIRLIFSVENLGLNQNLAGPAGGQNINIVGDGVGLVKAAQLPAALSGSGNLRTEIMKNLGQLPETLTGSGNLKTAVVEPLPAGSNLIGKVEVVGGGGGGFLTGTKNLTTTAAAVGSSAACSEILVQAAPDNVENVMIGDSMGQFVVLLPATSITIPAANVSDVYARAAAGTAVVNWLAKV